MSPAPMAAPRCRSAYLQLPAAVPDLQLPPDQVTLELPAREQFNIQGDINFYQNWQAFAAIERDLLAGQMLDTEYGLGYEDECLAISLAYRRKYAVDIAQGVPPSTSLVLRFSLKTGDQPVAALQPVPQECVQYRPSLRPFLTGQLDRAGKLLILRSGLGATGVAGACPKRHVRGQTL